MKIIERRPFIGPNIYATFPVLRLTVQLGSLEEAPSAEIEGFTDGLLAAIPSLEEHGCSYGVHGGFLRRLAEERGTWMGHILEHIAIEIQNLAGADVSFGQTRGTGIPGEYTIVYQYEESTVGVAAAELGLKLIHSLVPKPLRDGATVDDGFDFQVELEHFIRRAERRALGPSTASLVREADTRGIPWIRLNRNSLVQFGHGKFQQRIQATITSETRHIAVELASDKEETNAILRDVGLPVPRQLDCYREDSCVRSSRKIGYPVVIKPYNGNHGRGVSIGIKSDEEAREAFSKARRHSRCVLVESYIPGYDHRILVIGNEVVAVSKRVPGHIIGDGTSTIKELVAIVNSDPRRGVGHEKVLTRLELDDQAERLMSGAGYDEATVLTSGEVFYLRSTGNLSTGGTAIDMTDTIHPDNIEMAIRAAATIGLDVAGVDFLTPDITKSFRDVGGGICEVNAAPGFRMHIAPSEGQPRDVASKVMDMLFPPTAKSRIPIAAITGTNGKTTTTRMLAHIQKMCGETVGMTTTEGVYIDGRRSVEGDMTGPVSAQMVLRDPSVTVAVLETARGGLLRKGLGYRSPDVAACINVSADHLGMNGIDTLDQLAAVKRIPIEVASDTVVLNADDYHCLRMASHARAKHICYVTTNPQNPLVRQHIRHGGRAVALDDGVNGQMISIYDKHTHIPLLWTHLIPATLEGKAMHNVQNAMFAAGVAFSMGVSLENIRQGLRTFDTSFFQAPGRMNIFDKLGFKVILDYGHNPAAVSAMCNLVDRLADERTGRKVCVLSAPGDRRPEDVAQIAEIAGPHFDHFVLRQDDNLRGREPLEIPKLLKQSLMEYGVDESAIEVIGGEQESIERALSLCCTGDLLLIFADKITRSWKQVIYFHDRWVSEQSNSAEEPALVTQAQTMTLFTDLGLDNQQDFQVDERGVFLMDAGGESSD